MSTNTTLERLSGQVESAATGLFGLMQRGIGMQAQQRLLGQLLAQVGLALNSNLGKEALAELESRIRVLLYHVSGREQFTVVIAEFLRTQIKELEAGARRLNEVAEADYRRGPHDVGVLVRSHDRQAEAIRDEAKALRVIALRVAGTCAPLASVIPAEFDTFLSDWGYDAARILTEARAVVPGVAVHVSNPIVDADPSVPAVVAQPSATQYTFHLGRDKEITLRRESHVLADALLASMSRRRRELDDAQHPGSYDVSVLHAVTRGLLDDMASLEQRLAILVEKSWAPVKLVG